METRCLHCQKPLPLLKRLKKERYCSEKHRGQYIASHQISAMEELTRTVRRVASPLPQLKVPEELIQPAETKQEDVESPPIQQDSAPPPGPLPETLEQSSDEASATQAEEDASKDSEAVARLVAMVEADRHYLQQILDEAPVGIAVVSEKLAIQYVNSWFRSTLGFHSEDPQSVGLKDVLPHDDLPLIVETVFRTQTSQTNVLLKTQKDSESRTFRVSVQPFTGQDEDTEREALLIIDDLTEVLIRPRSEEIEADLQKEVSAAT